MLNKDFLDMIQRRISALERYPNTWGTSETQELMMLNFVEIRTHLLRPDALRQDPLEVRRAWIKFVSSINGESTNAPLHVILKEENKLELLPNLLGDFARWILQEYPTEKQ